MTGVTFRYYSNPLSNIRNNLPYVIYANFFGNNPSTFYIERIDFQDPDAIIWNSPFFLPEGIEYFPKLNFLTRLLTPISNFFSSLGNGAVWQVSDNGNLTTFVQGIFYDCCITI